MRALPPAGRIRPYVPALCVLHRLLDAALVGASLWVVCWLWGMPWNVHYAFAVAAAVAVFSIGAEGRGLYRSWRFGGLREELREILRLALLVAAAVIALAYLTKSSAEYSRRVLLTWMVVYPILLASYRISIRGLLRTIRVRGNNLRRAAIAGSGALAGRLGRSLAEEPWLGLELVGFFDDAQPTTEAEDVAGSLDALVGLAREGFVDIVYVALPLAAGKSAEALVERLADTPAAVYFLPDLPTPLLRSRWVHVGELTAASVFEPPLRGLEPFAKRAQDLLVAGVAVLVFALPMASIALAILLTSGRPVFFRQRRYGLDGREISVWKFRTMRVCEDGEAVRQATRGDQRVTRLGALLRVTSLDELPQILNVLQGAMSIVGPRPHPISLDEEHRRLIQGYMLRHRIKPGITGWAQVNGLRGETDTVEKMRRRIEHDLYYIQNWSTWFDLKVIGLTLLRGFANRNAY